MIDGAVALRRLAEVRLADAAAVGGKAAQLGELLAAGGRVPDGIVLDARDAALAAADAGLAPKVARELGPGPYAVRSSAIGEDGAERSHAGMYETVLDVAPEGLPAAVARVVASASAERARAYAAGGDRMAVIVQRMVQAAAAGVALTADPISGDRGRAVVSAVRGTGERLVSGATAGEEWVVEGSAATLRRRADDAIRPVQALEIATEARRIADQRGGPQDVEWAIDADARLWLLQARPMTGLPPELAWDPPARGAYTRGLRFGEWIGEPVTPLFESWLLPILEERLHARLRREIGQRAPEPHHVVVNGWYFYSLNWIMPGSMLRSLPSILWRVARAPRRAAGVLPRFVRHSFPILEREWRADVQPSYRAAVADAASRVETLAAPELPALVDELATLAGDYGFSLVALAGAAYKTEINLAAFWRRHLAAELGGSHLALLAGLDMPAPFGTHSVASLDWWHAPVPIDASPVPAERRQRAVKARRRAEAAARAALATRPRRLRAFDRLLADAQHLVPIREEQVRELTLPWPTMRRAVERLGEALVARGAIAAPDDVFFLARTELTAALDGDPAPIDVAPRRAARAQASRLAPPLLIGRMPGPMRSFWEGYPRLFGAAPSARAIVSGVPASAGRASGPVRIVRGPADFDALRPGEVLVAPLTAPAWTPLFARAAAVVTDIGSPAAHASIIAREYAIPAVVGCGDATRRLRDGMRVVVDGSTGNVEPEAAAAP